MAETTSDNPEPAAPLEIYGTGFHPATMLVTEFTRRMSQGLCDSLEAVADAVFHSNSWWNPKWIHRQKLTVGMDGISTDPADNAMPVQLTSPDFDFAGAQNNGQDLRFVDSNGYMLPYEIRHWDSAAQSADIYVAAPPSRGSTTAGYIWAYYGNPHAADFTSVDSASPRTLGIPSGQSLFEEAGSGRPDTVVVNPAIESIDPGTPESLPR